MTKEITKAYILQELEDKFALRELAPEVFAFSELVVPVYNIEKHLEKAEVLSETKSVTTTGGLSFLTVPKTERWTVHGYDVIFLTGTYTVAGLMVYRPSATYWHYLDLAAAQSVSYAVNLPKDAILGPGEQLAINIDGYSVTGNLQLRVDATVEALR